MVKARSSVSQPLVQAGLLGEAIDAAPAAVFVADDAGRYVAVNRTACELLGYDRDELLALTPHDLEPSSDVDARFEDLLRTGRLEGKARLRRKDGSEVSVAYRASETRVARMTFYVSVAFPES